MVVKETEDLNAFKGRLRELRKKHRLKVRATAVAHDRFGTPATTSRRLKLRR